MVNQNLSSTAETTNLDAMLLDAKLTVPTPRPGLVSRHELIARARDSHTRAVAISAPAGYGKTSLLAEWATLDHRPIAWVSLDGYDDDPGTLLTLTSSAFARAVGGNERLVSELHGYGASALGRAAPRLAAALRNSESPFVIMIDDLHELRSTACHDVLSVVISGIPDGSVFIAASRHEQPHVPWLRTVDDVIEIGATELALDAEGATRVFATAQVDLTAALADRVVERTEGWPVGVNLAATLSRDTEDAAAVISGDDLTVTDYLYRTTLAALPDSTQQFLRRTAVLEQLSGELCDYLLQQHSSQDTLHTLEASRVFLVRLDRRRHWFRYHALFREFLLGELRRAEPELVPILHSRAADWHESHASLPRAVEHLLLASEADRATRLVTQLILPTYESGQIITVQRWLTALGDEKIAAYPPLAVLTGWISALTGQPRDAEKWAALAEGATLDETPVDGSASFESGRAMLRSFLCAEGPEQSLVDAEYALSHEPSWSPWRDLALALAGEASLALGHEVMAGTYFAESSALAQARGNSEIAAISDAELALAAMAAGNWSVAEQHVSRARTAIDEFHLHDYAVSAMAFPAAARLALHQGKTKLAEGELSFAMRARPAGTYAMPLLAVRLRLHTAIAYYDMGDPTTARHLVREIDEIVARRPNLGVLLDEVTAFKGRLEGASANRLAGPPLTPAELRLLPYLQTHLTYAEIGARLFVSRNTVSTEVTSIYRKLGVSSRTAAVDQATSVGLLGE
ncbi:LuxR C-terminal-related transcriptional regulator (plasmid) [Coraliomargarita sp. W4R53]